MRWGLIPSWSKDSSAAASKTADFDTGISFQIGGVLITPTVHFGRDVRLSNGVTVGQELGPSPPNPLPTENH
jgi:serine acetyltransferase